jgi:AcrR family transcriptional regulator
MAGPDLMKTKLYSVSPPVKAKATNASLSGPTRYSPGMSTSRGRASRHKKTFPVPPAPREFQQARSRATYERILAAALELYAEQGFHATQTPDIAERAGMSVGGLYRYFRDKHQIFRELVHRGLEQNRQAQDRMLAAAEAGLVAGETDLHRAIEGVVDWTWKALHPTPPDLLRTLAAMAYLDPAFAELTEQYDRYERKALSRLLAKLTSRKRVPSPLAAARLLDLVVPNVGIWTALHPDEARGVKEATVEMIYRYLADPPE